MMPCRLPLVDEDAVAHASRLPVAAHVVGRRVGTDVDVLDDEPVAGHEDVLEGVLDDGPIARRRRRRP